VSRHLWPVVALPFALAGLAAAIALRPAAHRADGTPPPAVVLPPVARADALPRALPAPSARPAAPVALVARVTGERVAVHAAPGGAVTETVGARTEFGSPRSLGVVRREGRWLGVTLPELGNGRVGWVDRAAGGVVTVPTRVGVVVDLSARRLVVRRAGRVEDVVRVSVGRPGSSTPTGRFAVTDKLPGARYSASYGCCILALSGRQPHLPAGWTGGDRLAIHGTGGGEPIGSASSAGCLHASDSDLRRLMHDVPLGAPVVIRA
jgi:lipoprotein-anchoring transpeptidase ErfK/SrfK